MRLFPIALIAIGSFALGRHLGWIPAGLGPLIGPLLLIALGAALLLRGPGRGCRAWRRGDVGDAAAKAPALPR